MGRQLLPSSPTCDCWLGLTVTAHQHSSLPVSPRLGLVRVGGGERRSCTRWAEAGNTAAVLGMKGTGLVGNFQKATPWWRGATPLCTHPQHSAHAGAAQACTHSSGANAGGENGNATAPAHSPATLTCCIHGTLQLPLPCSATVGWAANCSHSSTLDQAIPRGPFQLQLPCEI